jgi:hypothetical protein
MLVGSMMMPDPIMFTVTRNISCVRVIIFCLASSAFIR